MSKGGQQTQTVELPDEVQATAKANMELAKRVGSLPYAPYFGASVAGFTPGQEASFGNMNAAASAFGLNGAAGQGMPKPNSNVLGAPAYSTEPVYNQAMSQIDPRILELYKSFFFPNANTASPASSPAATPARVAPPMPGTTLAYGHNPVTGYYN